MLSTSLELQLGSGIRIVAYGIDFCQAPDVKILPQLLHVAKRLPAGDHWIRIPRSLGGFAGMSDYANLTTTSKLDPHCLSASPTMIRREEDWNQDG